MPRCFDFGLTSIGISNAVFTTNHCQNCGSSAVIEFTLKTHGTYHKPVASLPYRNVIFFGLKVV